LPKGALVMADLHELNRTALNPAASVVVSACAGSGKTWLLVSRILRALLEGAQPSEILAITFTRKAAQEMSARLREWLLLLATADDAVVRQMLIEREVPLSRMAALMPAARQLYERFLTAEPGITITTFHSWFLQLLRRAPLDADALGDVNLQEETAALVEEAWERFAARVQDDPDSELGRGLDYLFRQYGLDNTRRALLGFLSRRADWWAYTRGPADGAGAVPYALEQMARAMTDAPDADIAGALWRDAAFAEALEQYESYLEGGVSRGRPAAEMLAKAHSEADPEQRLALVLQAVFTKEGPRKYSANKKQEAALGSDGQQRFFELHRDLAARLADIRARRQAQLSYRFNEAALRCGDALLDAYQSLKRERRVIDYADIEWRTYQLLCNGEHAIYMLCKLDSRYRHVLLDEFQDTNPLQWLTLQRWLESAAEADSRPQLFLVGDPKQSIYRFRRAEARLFEQSMRYLGEHFGAPLLTQNESRRCAPVVIDAVNRVFTAEPAFEGFQPHAAHYRAKPGRVEVLPLIGKDDQSSLPPAVAWRNPLLEPLAAHEDSRRVQEAAQLAQRILEIRRDAWIANDDRGEEGRSVRFSDIMILVSRRTHLGIYEHALREADIPFVTSRQGGLLDTLEAQDMTALLEFLVSPFADLKLAHALRSPVFGCSDDDLVAIARAVRAAQGGTWWSTLAALPENSLSAALARARALLAAWLKRADTLPVHDQLDRIYFEADVLHRYHEVVPAAMRGAVAANLHAFMQRALDADAGRYPSLPRFIAELADLRSAPAVEAPDEGIIGDASDAVHIRTVHGAKGLEAPIVWLLDAASDGGPQGGYETLLDWPANEPRPVHFSLWSRKAEQSPQQQAIEQREAALAAREDLNLLYVAMTRAKQVLIVSGFDNNRRQNSWYEKIRAALAGGDAADDAPQTLCLGASLTRADYSQALIPASDAPAPGDVDGRLNHPLPTGARRDAAMVAAQDARDGMQYGTRFHALMERLTEGPTAARSALQRALGVDGALFDALWRDAHAILDHPEYRRYFDGSTFASASNEVSLATDSGATLRIDRLVEFADEVCVLDYKTGALDAADAALLTEYRAQVAEYCRQMTSAFPGKRIHGLIIFAGGGCVAVMPSG
jgi:ATP-dependent helicase/nuclease subunit A